MVDEKILDLTERTTPVSTYGMVLADSTTTNAYITILNLQSLFVGNTDLNGFFMEDPLFADPTDNTKRVDISISGHTTGITLTVASAQTTSQTISIPNITAADDFLTRDFAQTPINKTINLTNNTLEDTSDAQGDLIKHNGTKFVRFPMGTSNQQIRVNAGGTDLEFFTAAASLTNTITFDSTDTGDAWTNQPAALTEIFGSTNLRRTVDLTNVSTCRFSAIIGTAGNTGAEIHLEYSINSGGAWNELASVASAMDLAIDATGLVDTGFIAIAAGAQTDVWLRVVGTGGNGMADPLFHYVGAELAP
jgi:hypothetical protein